MIKCTRVCLAALALLGLLGDAQSGKLRPYQDQQYARDPQRSHDDQSKQTFEIFTWTYPPEEVEPTSPVVDVVLKDPDPAETVTATCREADAEVIVMKDLFNNGQIISANDLKLGGCSHTREDGPSLIFEAQLHECECVSEVSTVKKKNTEHLSL